MSFPIGDRQMSNPRIETLTAAFYHDPLTQFLLPNEESRAKRLSRAVEFLLELSSKTWSAEIGNKKYAGVIGAAPPEEYPPPFFHLMVVLTKLILKSLSFTPLRVMEQWLHVFHQFDKIRPRQSHWYILVLGVHPDHQGKGLGGELLRPILQKADEERVAVYLESSNPKNLDFYGKYGFGVREKIVPVRGCPPMWGLVRKPVSEWGEQA
ncbi:MAG: GNAT family N-acetyltransferase [Desulfomonile sp.]